MSQEYDTNALDLVKSKGLYCYEYMIDYEKFKEELPIKEKLYSSFTDQKTSDKAFLRIRILFK